MRDDFKSVADQLEYEFKYGRKDFLNMVDNVDESKIYIYMDPPKITPERSGTGAKTGETVVGKFMMLKKGSLDAQYDESLQGEEVDSDTKYQAIIKPMIPLLDAFLVGVENCGNDWEIQYSFTEIINVDDLVMDGLLVNYTARSF